MTESKQSASQKTHGALTGVIVSDKMNRTRVIEVQNRKKHPKYRKTYTVSRRFVAHDAENAYHLGDVVTFAPSRPLSKTKKFVIIGRA